MTILVAIIVFGVAILILVTRVGSNGVAREYPEDATGSLEMDESALRLDLSLESKLYRDDGNPFGSSPSSRTTSLYD